MFTLDRFAVGASMSATILSRSSSPDHLKAMTRMISKFYANVLKRPITPTFEEYLAILEQNRIAVLLHEDGVLGIATLMLTNTFSGRQGIITEVALDERFFHTDLVDILIRELILEAKTLKLKDIVLLTELRQVTHPVLLELGFVRDKRMPYIIPREKIEKFRF